MVAVVNDLVDIARAFGGSTLLRRLSLEAKLGFDVPDDLRRALGDAVGGTITFELELEDPNAQVEVHQPSNARPSSELPGG